MEGKAGEWLSEIHDWKCLAAIMIGRWMLRSNVPLPADLTSSGSRCGKILRSWRLREKKRELENRLVVETGEENVLPMNIQIERYLEPDYETALDHYLKALLDELFETPYRFLLLKYPMHRLLNGHWNQRLGDIVTVNESRTLRSYVYSCVMQLAKGRLWKNVCADIAYWVWSSYLACSPSCGKNLGVWAACMSGDANQRDFAEQDGFLAHQLGDLSNRGDDGRRNDGNPVPAVFVNCSRIIVRIQSACRILVRLVPNMPHYDVLISRSLSAEGAFERLLAWLLGLSGHFKTTSEGERQSVTADYSFMHEPVRRYAVTGGLFCPEEGIKVRGGMLWRVRYPVGRHSFWHHTRELALGDLASHLGNVFARDAGEKQRLVLHLIKNADRPGMTISDEDLNRLRLSQTRSGGELFDKMAVRTARQLMEHYFDTAGLCPPGDSVEARDGGAREARDILGDSGAQTRERLFNRHVGVSEGLEIHAANWHLSNLKGMVLHRMEVYRDDNPLAILEDRAEMIWDRLIRTWQLPETTAWDMLGSLGRLPSRQSTAAIMSRDHYMLLIEELSQLSKEFFLLRLNHPLVHPLLACWAKYAVIRPFPTESELERIERMAGESMARQEKARTGADHERIGQWSEVYPIHEIRKLAHVASRLEGQISNGLLCGRMLHMLEESIGINGFAISERFWSLHRYRSPGCSLPMMERYCHDVREGVLPETLPEHVWLRLEETLAASYDELGGASPVKGNKAYWLLRNLAARLSDSPEVSYWHHDLKEGTYLKIKRQPPKKDDNVFGRFECSSHRKLPARLSDRQGVAVAIRTLSLVRDELALCPLPMETGISWEGRFYRHGAASRPEGIPPTWKAQIPLGSAVEAIGRLSQSGQCPVGVHQPFLLRDQRPQEVMEHCVIYRDPANRDHSVRLMPGIPEAPNVEGRMPYVVHCFNRVFLDEDGYPVMPAEARRSYIPLERFSGVRVDDASLRRAVDEYPFQWRLHLLDVLCDYGRQKRHWWNAATGDGCLPETVIRLYEDLGMGTDYETGAIDLQNPVLVEMLRFAGHVLNSPGDLVSSLEAGMPYHRKVILGEAPTLRECFRKAGLLCRAGI